MSELMNVRHGRYDDAHVPFWSSHFNDISECNNHFCWCRSISTIGSAVRFGRFVASPTHRARRLRRRTCRRVPSRTFATLLTRPGRTDHCSSGIRVSARVALCEADLMSLVQMIIAFSSAILVTSAPMTCWRKHSPNTLRFRRRVLFGERGGGGAR
jgi:hypothetical protein